MWGLLSGGLYSMLKERFSESLILTLKLGWCFFKKFFSPYLCSLLLNMECDVVQRYLFLICFLDSGVFYLFHFFFLMLLQKDYLSQERKGNNASIRLHASAETPCPKRGFN